MITKNPSPARQVNKFKSYARILVKHHFGTAARRIEYKPSGLTNFVFTVKHAEGNFVLRISPDPGRLNTFIKEQWAQKAARKAGAPVPEILEVGAEVIPFPYMISTTVEGDEATHHPARLEILRQMGQWAARINKIKTKGFGETFDWSENRLSRNKSFREYLEKEYRYGTKLQTLKKHRLLTQAQIRILEKIFAAAGRTRQTGALTHGDLRLKNVIADGDGKIIAILDWGSSTSNLAPQWELSIALHDLGIDGMQHFLNGYEMKSDKLKEIMPLVKAFNVTNYAAAIEEAVRSKDKTRLDQFRTRLSGTLDLYSF
jgi:aminoglycoside phosphotransferase (APT) family kinase protein